MLKDIISYFRKPKRGFEAVAPKFRIFPEHVITLPVRGTSKSAGYDFYAIQGGIIPAGEQREFPTDVKAFMQDDEFLFLFPRSSQGIKKGLMLANTGGVIDADYYNNPDNDGNITVVLYNRSMYPVMIEEGERIAQGIFIKFGKIKPDRVANQFRMGGIGSTGR